MKDEGWKLTAIGLCAATPLFIPGELSAASFDCVIATGPAEKYVCEHQPLSQYDEELEALYLSALSKANKVQKQALVVQQEHWRTHTRNVCETEVCFKHAYWSRQAELATLFEPKIPLLANESDKAQEIQEILKTAPLYGAIDNCPICEEVFTALQQMRDIHFVDPVVQTTSYEDPALDTWKERVCAVPPCEKQPLIFTGVCESRDQLSDKESCNDEDNTLGACKVYYLLPPYKIFMIPPAAVDGVPRYFFHSNNSFGPMGGTGGNPPQMSSGKFYEFQLSPQCDALARYVARPYDEHKLVHLQIMARGINYNSVIYHNQQYFLVVLEHYDDTKSYWLEIQPMDRGSYCRWSPVK